MTELQLDFSGLPQPLSTDQQINQLRQMVVDLTNQIKTAQTPTLLSYYTPLKEIKKPLRHYFEHGDWKQICKCNQCIKMMTDYYIDKGEFACQSCGGKFLSAMLSWFSQQGKHYKKLLLEPDASYIWGCNSLLYFENSEIYFNYHVHNTPAIDYQLIDIFKINENNGYHCLTLYVGCQQTIKIIQQPLNLKDKLALINQLNPEELKALILSINAFNSYGFIKY